MLIVRDRTGSLSTRPVVRRRLRTSPLSPRPGGRDRPSARANVRNSDKPSSINWTGRLATLVSLAGSLLVLVAALGIPAASLQYYRLRVPMQFLSYDRFVRAGALPAVVFVVVGSTLATIGWLSSRVAQRAKQSGWKLKRSGRKDEWSLLEDAPLVVRIAAWVALIGVFLVLWLVLLVAMIIWMVVPFVWLYHAFGVWAPISLLAVVICLSLWLFLRWRREEKEERKSSSRPSGGLPDSDDEDPQYVPFKLLQAVMWAAWAGAALLTIRWALRSWFGVQFKFYSTSAIWIVAAGVGVAMGAMFYFLFPGAAPVSSNSYYRRVALLELAIFGVLVYIVFASFYSSQWYAKVPQLLGGGQPEPVVAEIQTGVSHTDLAAALPAAGCRRQGDYWVCQNLNLIDTRGDSWLVADSNDTHARTLILPKSMFLSIQGE